MEELSFDLARIARSLPTTEVPCPACASETFDPMVVRNGFPVVRCGECGSLYLRTRPLEERLPGIYERFPQLSNGREGQVIDDAEDGRWEAEYRLRRLLEFAHGGRLLDIGCGRGDFMLVARGHFDVHGVDIVPRLRPEARSLPAFQGRLEDAAFPKASFDVVTAVEVFEHMFDPRRTMREVHRVIKPRGILLSQTGDADSLRAHLNLDTWTYLQPPVHLNVFSRAGLARLVDASGFERIRCWSFGRAPRKMPVLASLGRSEALRPILDWAARCRLIGQMCIWRMDY